MVHKKRKLLKTLLILITGVISLFFLTLFLNLKFDFIDQGMLAEKAREILEQKYSEKSEILGPEYMFFSRTAKEESIRTAERLNIKFIFDGVQNIPKDQAFVMITNEYSTIEASFLAYAVNYARQNNDAKVFRIQHYDGDKRSTYTLPVAQFGDHANKFIPGGEARVLNHLENGHPIIIVPTGKYDCRFFDGPGNMSDGGSYIRFRSGFLRFAKEAKVGLLPAYIDLNFPLWLKLLNSFLPRLAQAVIHRMAIDIFQNQVVKINFGEFIPYAEIVKDDLSSTTGYPQSVLDKYSKRVLELKGAGLNNRFYSNLT